MPDAAAAKDGHQPERPADADPAKRGDDQYQNPGVHNGQTEVCNVTSDKKKRAKKPRDTSKVPCRFWVSKKGCRLGDSCPYSHDPSLLQPHGSSLVEENAQCAEKERETETSRRDGASSNSTPRLPNTQDRSTATTGEPASSRSQRPSTARPVDPTRIVPKPAPQADPRTFQLQQLTRRFSPETTETPNGTSLAIKLLPSDPDFPFEMAFLDCLLEISTSYPKEKPKLHVRNKEMSRGFQINVEKGFDLIVTSAPNATLLRWLNTLDQKLESILTGEKAETIKIIANRAPARSDPAAVPKEPDSVTAKDPDVDNAVTCVPASVTSKPNAVARQEVLTPEQISKAHATRTTEIRQLEARMGRLPTYSRSITNEGNAYSLPIEPRRRGELPISLQAIKVVKLIVPDGYPLKPCKLELQGVSGADVDIVREAWDRRQSELKDGASSTLMGRINDLSTNLHVWSKDGHDRKAEEAKVTAAAKAPQPPRLHREESEPTATVLQEIERVDSKKSHVHYIPRPPEWEARRSTESDSGSSYHSSDTESDEASNVDEGEVPTLASHDSTSAAASSSVASATAPNFALDLPGLTLHNIELLTILTPSLTTRCLRCKTAIDLPSLTTTPRNTPCSKCSTQITASFQPALLHPNSHRAGTLHLTGASPMELLPSAFLPTCSDCSTVMHEPRITAERGAAPRSVCRKCHAHLGFRVPEVKFLNLASYAAIHGLPPRKPQRSSKAREELGVVPGEPLPKNGRCRHYGKSYRWFRFSCCGKVFPCDRCHDEAVKEAEGGGGSEGGKPGHMVERAERMICGWCSREQRFRPEDCAMCGKSVIRKVGGGFWEGGKGTRDKTRMSRKDPRKYKRVGGSRVGPAGKK